MMRIGDKRTTIINDFKSTVTTPHFYVVVNTTKSTVAEEVDAAIDQDGSGSSEPQIPGVNSQPRSNVSVNILLI